MLTQEQRTFLDKRQRLRKAWRWVGPLFLVGIVGFLVGLFLLQPLLVNPVEVSSQIQNRSMKPSTIEIMAAMLPIVVLACFGLLLAMTAFLYVAFSNERKYHEAIERLQSDNEQRNTP